jgi:hypothetical protein
MTKLHLVLKTMVLLWIDYVISYRAMMDAPLKKSILAVLLGTKQRSNQRVKHPLTFFQSQPTMAPSERLAVSMLRDGGFDSVAPNASTLDYLFQNSLEANNRGEGLNQTTAMVPGTGLPARSLYNNATRLWYREQLNQLPNRISTQTFWNCSSKKTVPKLYCIALFMERNQLKKQARALMIDTEFAEQLNREEPLKTIKDMARKAYVNGTNFWTYLNASATKSNAFYDEAFGVTNHSKCRS